MNVSVNRERTLLLIFPRRKEIYPLSTSALTQAQTSRRRLEDEYRDALILDADGTLRRIEHIDVIGPWGRSIGRKLISRLTDAWHIAVQLSEPLAWKFDELKQLLAECVNANGHLGFPEFSEPTVRQEVSMSILNSSSADQVFSLLRMPAPADALDVL